MDISGEDKEEDINLDLLKGDSKDDDEDTILLPAAHLSWQGSSISSWPKSSPAPRKVDLCSDTTLFWKPVG